MQNLLQRDLGSSMLSIAIILGWLGLFFVFLRVLTIAINISSLGKISDFRITDGKGIGVVLQLSNEKEQWFFEDEIDLLDENGNVIKKNNDKKENSNFIFDFLRGLNYENKNKVSELLNPINFFIWLVVSFKDIF